MKRNPNMPQQMPDGVRQLLEDEMLFDEDLSGEIYRLIRDSLLFGEAAEEAGFDERVSLQVYQARPASNRLH